MLTVLLVDDEDSVLEMLKNSIGWQELGVDTLLTATNGREAYDIAARQTVELVIADIRMPVMDGLTLVRLLRARSPETHCILLSAYDEFEYAREAISLGVENYLLKPIVAEDIEETVRRALINIYAKRNGRWLAYSNTILRWLTGAITQDELAERALVHGINLYSPKYVALCFMKRQPFSLTSFCERCSTALAADYDVNYCQDETGKHWMVLSGREIDVGQIAERLAALVADAGLEGKISIAVGNEVSEAQKLVKSCQSAMKRIDMSSMTGAGSILTDTNALEDDEMVTRHEDILLLLYECSARESSAPVERYALGLSGGEPELMLFLQSCVYAVLSEFPDAGERARDALFKELPDAKRLLSSQGFPAAAARLLTAALREFSDRQGRFNHLVLLALNYIRGKYRSGVSIREFCNRLGVNPAYLGYLFKQEFGTFFNEYLMRVRILNAIVLLRNPDLKINDITVQTGFSSPSYFIRCFKAVTGMSPAKYRISRCNILSRDGYEGMPGSD